MRNTIFDEKSYTDDIVIHSSVIEEVSKYPNVLDSIREYIANAWDADSERLEITISDQSLHIEDWGTGITNFKVFWGVADQHKASIELTPKFKRKPIGRKGLGKLSFMMIGNKISVETRTSYKAEYSDADFTKMKFYGLPRKRIDEVLSHEGTQITITELKTELHKDEIIKYIKENLYGLILPIASNKPMMILVNEEKVELNRFSGTSGIISTALGDIYCKLIPTKTAKIDLLYRGVKVREANPAPTHPAKGYFNVDWVTPTSDRNNFADSEEARLFFAEIKKYVLKHIPAKSEDAPKDLEKTLKEVSKLFDEILRDLGMLPENLMPTSRTARPSDLEMGAESERENYLQGEDEKEKQEPQTERKRFDHRILKGENRPLKSAYGIYYVIRKAGKDKPAVIPYKEEKTIIINRDHDLIKNILELRPIQKNIALGFLIARGHFHILESFRSLVGYEEFVDSMVATLFSKMTAPE